MENIKGEKTHEINRTRKYIIAALASCLLIFLFVFFNAKAANAASLYLSPSLGSYQVDKTFSVSVFVSSPDQAMNAAGGVITFPADKIEVTSLSKSGTIFSLWVQEPNFSNSAGTINFEGIIMNPGFTGASGKIITINFKTKNGGQATLNFSSGSILANDGAGTNILASMGSAKIEITLPVSAEPTPTPSELIKKADILSPTATAQAVALEETTSPAKESNTPAAPIVTSPTHPDQGKWYANNNPEFDWKLSPGVSGISIYLSQSPTSNPGSQSDGSLIQKKYAKLD